MAASGKGVSRRPVKSCKRFHRTTLWMTKGSLPCYARWNPLSTASRLLRFQTTQGPRSSNTHSLDTLAIRPHAATGFLCKGRQLFLPQMVLGAILGVAGCASTCQRCRKDENGTERVEIFLLTTSFWFLTSLLPAVRDHLEEC